MKNDNISAISTGLVASGVAIIRLSGDSPLSIAEKMFKPSGRTEVKDFEPNKMYPGEIIAEDFTDYGLCVYFKAPKSFTGEDIVEFHSHGGVAISKGILQKTISLGARLAENGEFTKRAFLNGKLSLASAEGLINMINSQSISSVKAGYALYREKLTSKICKLQDEVTDVLSQIDVDMDFPEEDLELTSRQQVKNTLEKVVLELEELIKSYRIGRVVKDGVKVGIVGKPNTGKSSILNALLNYDKAIVSDVAGTTRDVVEGSIDINGVRFNFSDTAGIRENADKIEAIGVDLSKKTVLESDLILFVLDASCKTAEDEEIYMLVRDKNLITVVNKTDLSSEKDTRANVYISALKKENVEELRQKIYEQAIGSVDLNGDFLMEERHLLALTNAKARFECAIEALNTVPLDLLAIDVKDGWDYLGEISGKTATEEIINNIFSKFCVGK